MQKGATSKNTGRLHAYSGSVGQPYDTAEHTSASDPRLSRSISATTQHTSAPNSRYNSSEWTKGEMTQSAMLNMLQECLSVMNQNISKQTDIMKEIFRKGGLGKERKELDS